MKIVITAVIASSSFSQTPSYGIIEPRSQKNWLITGTVAAPTVSELLEAVAGNAPCLFEGFFQVILAGRRRNPSTMHPIGQIMLNAMGVAIIMLFGLRIAKVLIAVAASALATN
ncbi:hypothetical protein WOC76_01670 [Methylocystis sp. IM3]|uniref:hypothetical protein n=1 Tax=unclassified Methylocystis TaxID=2625913 RepID=UPI0030F59D3F